MEEWFAKLLTEHRAWSGPLIFALAFAESMAFLSIAVPFTTMIVGAGALMLAGVIDPWVIIPWGVAGASVGDAVSYWIGRYFEDKIHKVWPFRSNPALLENGHRFFVKWGTLSVFIGRFFGPLRAAVPIVAGMMAMPQLKFQVANVVSAVVWMPMLLYFGAGVGKVFEYVFGKSDYLFLYVFLLFLLLPFAGALVVWLRARVMRRK
jgi:membrane protein DedA with SNARE-associated domain